MLMSLARNLTELGEGQKKISLSDLEQATAVEESLFDQDQRPTQCAMPSCIALAVVLVTAWPAGPDTSGGAAGDGVGR